jgi:hypothetical protein
MIYYILIIMRPIIQKHRLKKIIINLKINNYYINILELFNQTMH